MAIIMVRRHNTPAKPSLHRHVTRHDSVGQTDHHNDTGAKLNLHVQSPD